MIGTILGAVAAAAISSIDLDEKANMLIQNHFENNRSKLVGQRNPYDSIIVGFGSEEINGSNYRDAVNTLIGVGFTNISLNNQYEKKGWLSGDRTGTVVDISIGGNKYFNKTSIFSRNSFVVLTVINSNKNNQLYCPELVKLQQQPNRVAAPSGDRRCGYCDGLVVPGQRFCNRCGAPL